MYTDFSILFVLVILNAFFSLSEVVLIATKRTRLENLVEKKSNRAVTALYLIDRPEFFLSTVQIGITLISLVFGYFSLQILQPHVSKLLSSFSLGIYVDEVAPVIIAIVATYIMSLFAELVPKRIGIIYADKLSLIVAYPLYICLKFLFPLVWILSKSSNAIFRLLNINVVNKASYTEYEIKSIIHESQKNGDIDATEKEIIDRIFSLGDRNITSLMLHRQHLVFLETTNTVKQARSLILKQAHYQYPVCQKDLDDIKGTVTLKELYNVKNERKKLHTIMKKPVFVPESISVYGAMEQMKNAQQKNCFIVNEYGTVEGMLTLTQILEAIVGDIATQGSEKKPIIPTKNGDFLVDASISFYDFLKYYDKEEYHNPEEEESDEYDTVAGFLLYELERIPNEGESLEWKEFTFTIADMDGHKVDKVMVSIRKQEDEQENAKA